jgi:hypothetical protein
LRRSSQWTSSGSIVKQGEATRAAFAGIVRGVFGLAEMRPLSFAATALIIGYSLFCSLLANEFAKLLIIRFAATAASAPS